MTINYKPIGENLESGMQQLGNQVRSVPHIIIGGNKSQVEQKSVPITPQNANSNIPDDIFNKKEQKIINLIKKWAFILAVAYVVGYAVYRMVFG